MLYLVKQKTAYELRIIDWSSDVCSSGLVELVKARLLPAVFERPQVRIGEIADVDVVTNAGAVARFVVRAENLHVERLTGCAPQQLWNQVRLGCMRFADAARTAGTSRLEIAQRRGPQAVRACGVTQHQFAPQLRVSIRVDRSKPSLSSAQTPPRP